MKKLFLAIALFATLNFTQAQTFTVSLTPDQDGGGARTGSGGGTLTLSGSTITFNNIPWSGLSANASATHIHGPAGVFPAAAGVLYGLSPNNTTVGGTSGTYSGILNLEEGKGGFSIVQQLSQLNSGQWYLNIHSSAFGGGEIRGQITVVPEPSTWALAALGSAMLAWRARRKN